MPEAKGRDKVIEECHFVPRCYEFSSSGSIRQAGIRAQTGETAHSNPPEAGHFSYWPAPVPCRGSCRGIASILVILYPILL